MQSDWLNLFGLFNGFNRVAFYDLLCAVFADTKIVLQQNGFIKIFQKRETL